MRELRQSRAGDLASLQMENELLAHEVRHLRALLKQAERHADPVVRRAKAQVQKEQKLRKKAEVQARRAARQLKRSRDAEDDLRWLLQRLGSSPAGPLLRRRPGFAALYERYGAGKPT